MHNAVIEFIESVKLRYPKHFDGSLVLDCGSLDINGNNRRFFTNSAYKGIDIVKGRNVDIVTKVHEFVPEISGVYDVVISTEMLEHDVNYVESLKAMFRLTKHGGLLLITAAGEGRKEHGTTANSPNDSPLTNEYYKNVTVEMLLQGLSMNNFVGYPETHVNKKIGDIYFVGIKK